VDMTKIWDDSNGRLYLWALASTTIGVNLQLLASALGLVDQRQDPFSILSRGFDYINRFFMATEPSIYTHQIRIDDSNTARFDAESAQMLDQSAWLA